MDPNRVDSPPPRFSESVSSGGSFGPRFTELINSSPPYQQYLSFPPDSPHAPHYGSDGMAQQHYRSISSKDGPPSPGPRSPGLESVWDDEGNKEVIYPPPQHAENKRHDQQQYRPYQHYSSAAAMSGQHQPHDEGGERRDRTICGVRRKLFWIIVALIVLIALGVGLGAGLGVGLNKSKSGLSDDNSGGGAVGGGLNPHYYSTEGAFNGSGIALASQSFSQSLSGATQGTIVMYFQHWSGQIRWKQLSNTGQWLGGDVSEVVAVDAKNSTPLSAVSYSIGGKNEWHIFYIDKNNILRQRSNSNETNVWVDGPIGDLNLTVFNSAQVGMQACWYGNDYGDSAYLHTPLPNADEDAQFQNQIGMRMWFAKNATTFAQYAWRAGQTRWQYDQDWHNLNGHAGVGCYSWGPGNVTYTMFVDTKNTARFFWKDTDTNLTNTTTHPINVWVEAPINIPNVDPASSLGYTNAFYVQDGDTHMIHGYNVSWAAENSSFINDFVVQGAPGIPGTHLSVTAVPTTSGGNTLMVFYQTNGTDITEYTRDLVAGQWSEVNIQIPTE